MWSGDSGPCRLQSQAQAVSAGAFLVPYALLPSGPAESLFKESYYQLMKTALKEDGILCCQGERAAPREGAGGGGSAGVGRERRLPAADAA